MKFYIITLGCKVNAYESEIIKENLIKNNYILADNEDDADIIMINTCSVTNMADNKSKKMVRKAIRNKKIVVVCGCSSENKKEEYESMPIDILIGNKDKSKLHEILDDYLTKRQTVCKFYDDKSYEFENMVSTNFTSHTRAFVKIQDGCNNFCSYCIIPYIRKNVRSKDFNTAIEEIKGLVLSGHKEIVLTGIHTGAYLTEDNHTLADLIHEISKIEDLKRIRISSIEVTELNDKLLNEIKNNEKIVNHFHVPLQAGSDEILKRMNRKYNLDEYKKIIAKLRKIKEDVSITTDVIVGHPYETEELFNETIKTCRELNFAKIHVFPYSLRDGTAASRMPMQVDSKTKKERSRTLNQLSLQLEEEFYKKHLGKTSEILIEEVYDDYSIGCTSNYIKVRVNKKLNKNHFYNVKLISFENKLLIGEVI